MPSNQHVERFSSCSKDEWLYHLEHQHAQEVHLRLILVKKVAINMALVSWSIPVIIVAGTNGKGSSVAALEAIYRAAGYRVGCYTSPHLISFNERIRMNGQCISDDDLCAAFHAIEQARGDTPLTYFEMATLAALWYFKSCSLDVMILEVGMGGRLDATNIVDADVSMVTSIDLDHQAYLGHTREDIGFEKAGIFRPQQICIYAEENPPHRMTTQAQHLGVQWRGLGRDYHYVSDEKTLEVRCLQTHKTWVLPRPSIHPQAAASAVMAVDALMTRLPVAPRDLEEAMRQVFIPGRQQLIPGDVRVLYDVAHNPHAVRCLARTLEGMSGVVHAVFSALKDKDLPGLIHPLRSRVHAWYPTVLSGQRAASEALLCAAFQSEIGVVPTCFDHPITAYRAAYRAAKPGDLILVYGSFLLVSALMTNSKEETL